MNTHKQGQCRFLTACVQYTPAGAPEYQADRLPHSTADVKNDWNYISRPSLRAKKELTLPEYTTHTEIKFEAISRVITNIF